MESLRILPVAMFLTGVLLMYAGFKNIAPLDIVRGNIGKFQDYDDNDLGYGMDDDPFYGGVPMYHRPAGMGNPGGYYG